MQKVFLDKVVGISGSGQQHGSVYWSGEANELLNDLIPCKELSSQLQDAFHGVFTKLARSFYCERSRRFP